MVDEAGMAVLCCKTQRSLSTTADLVYVCPCLDHPLPQIDSFCLLCADLERARGTLMQKSGVRGLLGQSKNPTVIQSHLKKLFAGIFKVKFSEGNSSIIAMCSLDQEEVPLIKPVQVTDQVEVWLHQLNLRPLRWSPR